VRRRSRPLSIANVLIVDDDPKSLMAVEAC
jgi:hypothetical protein